MKLFAYQYFSSSSEGKLKTGEIFLILFFNKKHKHVWAKLRLGKLVCWCKRQKITWQNKPVCSTFTIRI